MCAKYYSVKQNLRKTKGKITGLCPHRACGREIQIQYLQILEQLRKKEIG